MYRALLVVVMMCFVGLYVTDGQVRSPQKEMKLLTESLFAKEVNKDEVLIKEILQSWQAQYQQLKSFSFEIDVETIDNSFGTKRSSFSKCTVKLLMHSNGNCSVRLETLSDKKQPAITEILHFDRVIQLHHLSKRYSIDATDKPWSRQVIEDLSKFLFASVPFFVNDTSDLSERFTMTIVQNNKDFTWIRMEPRTGMDHRTIKVGQMGIVNYRNTISPKYFPLRIMWKEPGNNEVTWEFKKVTFNDPAVVKASDFEIDTEQLVLQGWSGSKSSSPHWLIRWIKGISSK